MRHLAPIELIAYKQDESLCVVSHIKHYLQVPKELRGQHCQLLTALSSHTIRFQFLQ